MTVLDSHESRREADFEFTVQSRLKKKNLFRLLVPRRDHLDHVSFYGYIVLLPRTLREVFYAFFLASDTIDQDSRGDGTKASRTLTYGKT